MGMREETVMVSLVDEVTEKAAIAAGSKGFSSSFFDVPAAAASTREELKWASVGLSESMGVIGGIWSKRKE